MTGPTGRTETPTSLPVSPLMQPPSQTLPRISTLLACQVASMLDRSGHLMQPKRSPVLTFWRYAGSERNPLQCLPGSVARC